MAENVEENSTESTTETNINIEMSPPVETRTAQPVRTPDRTMRFADHISSAIEEITPLLEQARPAQRFSIRSWLSNRRQDPPPNPTPNVSPSDSFVIDLGDEASISTHDRHNHTTTVTDNLLNNIREVANEVNQNNNNNDNNNSSNNNNDPEGGSSQTIDISRETRILVSVLQKYFPFVLILFAKYIYDYRTVVSSFVVLVLTFIRANDNLKREITKRQNKSWASLALILGYVVACILFIDFMVDTPVFIPSTQPITMTELLWSILVSDFVAKLLTIVLKVFLTCLPVGLLAFQKRGKYYFMVEATSQLYRCVIPIQPWLYYLHEAYQGPERIVGIFLSGAYTLGKWSDLSSRGKLFRTAIVKLMQNVNLGVAPSKEQLTASGGICTICHEEYSTPVKLHCKHIFCETCVTTWLDRERSCPLCRASITDDPVYRDGHTTYFIQMY